MTTKLRKLKINSPLAIFLPRKTMKDRRVALNLNIYRNLDYRMNNAVKIQYKKEINVQLKGKELETPVEVTYQVFKKTLRRMDKMNVISIVSKYLLDAMTEAGVIEDDNDQFIKTETILPTELDSKGHDDPS